MSRRDARRDDDRRDDRRDGRGGEEPRRKPREYPWGEWTWSPPYNRYYRQRIGADGQQEYEYDAQPGIPSLAGQNAGPAYAYTQQPGTVNSIDWQGQDARQPARQANTPYLAPRQEYFVPGEGIDREVITADLCRYLDHDALVRPGKERNPRTGIIENGFIFTSSYRLTPENIVALKVATQGWLATGPSRGDVYRNTHMPETRPYNVPLNMYGGGPAGTPSTSMYLGGPPDRMDYQPVVEPYEQQASGLPQNQGVQSSGPSHPYASGIVPGQYPNSTAAGSNNFYPESRPDTAQSPTTAIPNPLPRSSTCESSRTASYQTGSNEGQASHTTAAANSSRTRSSTSGHGYSASKTSRSGHGESAKR